MATVSTELMTAEDFLDWASRPENQERFWELDQGKVVEMPSPGEIHGVVCGLISYLLWRYVIHRGQGYVCTNDTGLLVARDPDSVRGPDLMLFLETRSLDQLSRRFSERIPRLVVEVLTPGDQITKLNRRLGQ